ncbi:MAG: hypothetical protein U0Q15_11680 [Kineosporiaceae bacterium]
MSKQPDYDFFTTPSPQGSTWGTPPGPGPSSPAPADPWGAPAPPSAFATPSATQPGPRGSAGTGWHGGTPSTITARPVARPSGGMSSGAKALIAVAVVVGLLVVGGIAAAVVIPVFLNQKAKAEWQATSVSAPGTFEGQPAVAVTQVPGAAWYRLPGGRMLVAPMKYDRPRTAAELDEAVASSKRPDGYGAGATSFTPPEHADALLCAVGDRGFACFVYSRSASLVVSSPDMTRDPAGTARTLWALTVHQN